MEVHLAENSYIIKPAMDCEVYLVMETFKLQLPGTVVQEGFGFM